MEWLQGQEAHKFLTVPCSLIVCGSTTKTISQGKLKKIMALNSKPQQILKKKI